MKSPKDVDDSGSAEIKKRHIGRVRRAPLRERDIEKRLVQRAKELGGEVRKVRWIGRRSAPDRIVMLPEVDRRPHEFGTGFLAKMAADEASREAATIWVELKAPGVKPEAHQLREHARMRKMGQRVEVVDSYERIEEILK
jgi:hypothetical protein